MKKFLLGVGTLLVLLAVVALNATSGSNAQAVTPADSTNASAAASPAVDTPVDHSVLMAGVWNEGKAVFSDVQALDIFWRYARGYKPTQPIAYSHRLHVEKNKMECQYCHSGVAKSPFATVPSVESCMGCHKVVKTESPEIKKLAEAFEKKEPIRWEPVNHLPEHVYFSHERHTKAGVACQNCHGQIQKMEVVEKVASLKMGFCVSCHRDKGASIDCAVCHQ